MEPWVLTNGEIEKACNLNSDEHECGRMEKKKSVQEKMDWVFETGYERDVSDEMTTDRGE
jgi:hypothetical protein